MDYFMDDPTPQTSQGIGSYLWKGLESDPIYTEIGIEGDIADYDEAQLCDSTELQQESTDRPVSIGQIPLLSNLPGDYGFSFTLKRTPGNKTTWEYSDKHNQLFIDMNKVVTVQFVYQTTKPLSERLFIRALPVYCSTDFIGMPVNRCSIHSAEDDPTQRAHSGIMCHCFMYNNAGHVVRCETSGAFYDFDIQSKRHSVVIPIPNVRQAGNYYDATYTFACKTSCQKGMQRRPINVVFTLENCGGDVLGRCSLGVKICSCPKRDKDKLEKNGERHSKKNSKIPISQDDEDQREDLKAQIRSQLKQVSRLQASFGKSLKNIEDLLKKK